LIPKHLAQAAYWRHTDVHPPSQSESPSAPLLVTGSYALGNPGHSANNREGVKSFAPKCCKI
jgi:hypothetical protein